jgi:hypothetical protein
MIESISSQENLYIFHEKGIGQYLDPFDNNQRKIWKKDLSLIKWDEDNIYFEDKEGYDIFLTEGFYY